MEQLLIVLLTLGISNGQMPPLTETKMAMVGVNFQMELSHGMFFNESIAETSYGTRYVVSMLGRPDIPEWLRVVHEQNTEPAFVYGTPLSLDDTTTLEITAIDRNTNTVSQLTRKIQVTQLSEEARYFVDLTIRNLDLGEFFTEKLYNDILVRMHQLWPGDIKIAQVATLAEVGERSPVPDAPAAAKALKNGVRVRVGGSRDFSNPLRQVEEDLRGACGPGEDAPYVIIDNRFTPDFDIDWCKYKLITPDMMAAMTMPTPAPAQIVLSGQDLDLSVADIPRRDFSVDFFVTVVFPILLALVLSILLSIFFFCSRQGAERRDELTPETQLSQFNTIRRATTNLRLMSHRRDGPPPLSPSPRHGRREPPSPLPRAQPPPPYRLPPSYPTDDRPTATEGASASPQRLEEDVAEDLNLVSHTSPLHSGNDNMAQQ